MIDDGGHGMIVGVCPLGRSIREATVQRGATDALGTEQAHDFANAIDRLPVPGADNIADERSGARGRSIRIKAHDQNAAPAAQRLRRSRSPDYEPIWSTVFTLGFHIIIK